MIERWLHEREHWEQFRGEPFVSIDPGADGYALFWPAGGKRPTSYCHAHEPEMVAKVLLENQARVVVVEGQFVGKFNAQSALDLVLRSGMSLGWTACLMHSYAVNLNLFEVLPASWQAAQRRRLGLSGKREKGEGIKLALQHAAEVFVDDQEWSKANKKQREGMAAALAIGRWWLSLFEG